MFMFTFQNVYIMFGDGQRQTDKLPQVEKGAKDDFSKKKLRDC